MKPNLAGIPAAGDARAEAITQRARTATSQSLLDSRLDGCLRAGKQRLNPGSDPVGHLSSKPHQAVSQRGSCQHSKHLAAAGRGTSSCPRLQGFGRQIRAQNPAQLLAHTTITSM